MALDFDTDLDSVSQISTDRMRVVILRELLQVIERPINELCGQAGSRYRKTPRHAEAAGPGRLWAGPEPAARGIGDDGARIVARGDAGEDEAFQSIAATLKAQAPEAAIALRLHS